MRHSRHFSVGKVGAPQKEPMHFIEVAAAQETRTPERSISKPPASPSNYPDAKTVGEQWGQDAYKIARLQEMADLLKGTNLEPDTVMFLAMLVQEDGSITAERRHDCQRGWCEAIGIQGHNICQRGTPLIYVDATHPQKFFCSWKKGDKRSPTKQFEEAYPLFATEWREQFREYVSRQSACRASGTKVRQCIQNWNPNEVGRIAKVESREPLVRAALGL